MPRSSDISFLSFSEGESLSEPEGYSLRKDDKIELIQNFEFFTDSHIPGISSTEIRASIPEHTGFKELFAENPKFIIK